jgi:hypothetical protein
MIVMFALVMLGLLLTYTLGNGQNGAGATAQQNATDAIAKDGNVTHP